MIAARNNVISGDSNWKVSNDVVIIASRESIFEKLEISWVNLFENHPCFVL